MSDYAEKFDRFVHKSDTNKNDREEDVKENNSSKDSRTHYEDRWFVKYSFWIGLVIRLVLMIVLPWALDDGNLFHGVKYTDIDYHVYSDAAEYLRKGKSPYDRHTYRYTPFLAEILASNLFYKRGRWLFCIADAICGYLLCRLRSIQQQQQTSSSSVITLVDCLWWLYNPFVINICTRGSAESFIVLLPVLLTVSIILSSSSSHHPSEKNIKNNHVNIRAILAGIIHGMAIHAKLYPIIYTVSFMASLSIQQGWKEKLPKIEKTTPTKNHHNYYPFPWCNIYRFIHLIKLWVIRLFGTSSSLLFLVMTITSFGLLNYAAYIYYGPKSLNEALLYHFSRLDHRHNYSMYWYWIYLHKGKVASTTTATAARAVASMDISRWLLSLVSVIPQAILLAFISLGVAPHDLTFALFLQTFIFVAQNKVLTAQYFTWYLCLLPLCSNRIQWNTKYMTLYALPGFAVSIVTWLASAFCLEMLGLPVQIYVWAASLFFYIASIHLVITILVHYKKNDLTPSFTQIKAKQN